jgi:hypothetical protein
LTPVFLDENTHMRIPEIFFSQQLPDFSLQFIRRETLHPQYPEQGKADIPLGTDANGLVQLLFLKDGDFNQILRADFIVAIQIPSGGEAAHQYLLVHCLHLFGRFDLLGWQSGWVGLFSKGGLGSAREGTSDADDAEEENNGYL